jgi:hypothetical protein
MLNLLRGVLAGALLLIACGLRPAHAQDADPGRWGLYARLAGAERQAGPEGYRLRWRWIRPNEELAEDYIDPRTGNVSSTNIITPGEKPGTLMVTGSFGPVTKIWDGTVLADGSVDFIARGMRKIPYRAMLLDDGTYEMHGLILEKGGVVSVKPVAERDRYTALIGPSGAPVVAGPATAAAVEKPAVLAAAMLTASSQVPAAGSSPAATPARDFGFLERYVDRLLVSDKFTLEIYREGDAIALHLGDAGGYRTRRFLVSLDAAAGSYALRETTFVTPEKERRAYFDDGGDLYLEYVDENYRYMTRFREIDGSVVFQTRTAERRRFGRYGPYDDWSSTRFAPASDEALRLAAINNAQYRQQQARSEQEARERQRERDQQWMNNMNALNQGLQNALDDATASEQQSRAALDETLQLAAQQAAYERELAAPRDQQQANAHAADDARRAREATQHQYEVARQFEAQQQERRRTQNHAQQQAQPATTPRAAPTPARPTTAGDQPAVPSCPKVYQTGIGASGYATTQAEAERWARRDIELHCPMARYSAGAMQCSQKSQGDVVEVDSKGRSTKVGERLAWMCHAEYRCTEPSDACAKGPAKGSAQ